MQDTDPVSAALEDLIDRHGLDYIRERYVWIPDEETQAVFNPPEPKEED